MGTLAYVLDEEYRAFCRNVIRCASQTVKDGYVSSPEYSRSLAFVVELMGRAGVAERCLFLQLVAEQNIFQSQGAEIIFRFYGKMTRHWSMQRGKAVMLEYIMQGCDVAEADEPFGVLAKLGEVELPCQMHSAVSAAAAKDDFGFLVVHSFLQVFQSLLYASCIGSMCTSCMFGDDHFQSP